MDVPRRCDQGADEVEVAARRQAQDDAGGRRTSTGAARENTDGDEASNVGRRQSGAGGRFDGRPAKALAPGVEGGGGHAFFGAEGDGGKAGAFKT